MSRTVINSKDVTSVARKSKKGFKHQDPKVVCSDLIDELSLTIVSRKRAEF